MYSRNRQSREPRRAVEDYARGNRLVHDTDEMSELMVTLATAGGLDRCPKEGQYLMLVMRDDVFTWWTDVQAILALRSSEQVGPES